MYSYLYLVSCNCICINTESLQFCYYVYLYLYLKFLTKCNCNCICIPGHRLDLIEMSNSLNVNQAHSQIAHSRAGNTQPGRWHTARQCCVTTRQLLGNWCRVRQLRCYCDNGLSLIRLAMTWAVFCVLNRV